VAARRLALIAALLAAAPAAAHTGDRQDPLLLGTTYRGVSKPYAPRLLLDADFFADPYSPLTDRSLFDIPSARRTRFGRTVDVGTLSGTRDGGNAEAEFQRFAASGRIEVADSFAHPFAYLVQGADPEDIQVFAQDGSYFDRTFTGPSPGPGALVPASDPTKLTVQGLGCMADPGLHARFAIVALQSGNATLPSDADTPPDVGVGGREIGLRGFVKVSALPARIGGVATARVLRSHDVGCVPPSLHARGGSVATIDASQPWQRFTDLYLGARSWLGCGAPRPRPEAGDCGTPYAQYQAPAGLTPSGQEVGLLAASTTGVAGDHAGVVRAVYRSGPFRRLDEIGYADPNVPCGAAARPAVWIFGDANPRPAPGQVHIWGWRPELRAAPRGGDWPVIEPGLAPRACGAAARSGPPRARRCPHGRTLARDASVLVLRVAGGQNVVCDRRTDRGEELDEPVLGQHARIVRLAGRRLTIALTDRLAIGPSRRQVVTLDVPAYVGGRIS